MPQQNNSPHAAGQIHEFLWRKPDNLIRVETDDGGDVRISLARDNFSERRKSFLIKHLAMEGFIPDRFQFLVNSDYGGITWQIGTDWVEIDSSVAQYTDRICGQTILSCGIIWSMLILVLISL